MLNSTESYGNSGNMKNRVDDQSILKRRPLTSTLLGYFKRNVDLRRRAKYFCGKQHTTYFLVIQLINSFPLLIVVDTGREVKFEYQADKTRFFLNEID